MPGNKIKILCAFIIAISLLAGCSPMLRYKVLSVFFDGVPDPSIVVVDSLPKTDISAAQVLASRKMEPEFFFHPPYSEKKCTSCHQIGGGNQTIKMLPELCYSCHDDWSTKYKTLHGPVASGYCLRCHNQHLAKLPKLLLRSGQDLCLYCHNSKQVFRNKVHEHVGKRNCTDCHSPHGGDNRGMLRPGSCYNCHENFANKFKTLHGPVASVYCTACHASHETKIAKLLLRESQQICFYCHDRKYTLKNAAHKDIKKSNCTQCHNPHGGEDRFILIQPGQVSADSSKDTILISTATFAGTLPISLLSETEQDSAVKIRLHGQVTGHISGIIHRELEIYALNDSHEMVGVTRVYENGNFAFLKLPPYNNYLFIIKDENGLQALDINTLFIGNTIDKEVRKVDKSNDGYFWYKYLPFQDLKIYVLDEQKDTLISAQLNKDGLFFFGLLPEDTGLTFLLSGDARVTHIDEMSIVVNGRMRLIKKSEDNLFRFVQLPSVTVRLYLMDEAGDTLQAALMNDNGFFEFKNGLPYREEYHFLLEAGNVESIDEIQIVCMDEWGKEKIITPVKEKGHYFIYKKLFAQEAKLYLLSPEHDTLDVAIMDKEGSDSTNRDLSWDTYVPVHLKKIEEKILSVASTHLEFNFGESVIQIPSYLYIEGINRLLIKNPDWNLVLSGHTDNVGSDAFNLGLSKKRAEAVKKALVKRGIPAGRIFTKYYGETTPVADNSTPEGRKKNRRVEMAIIQSTLQQPKAQVVQDTGQDWEMSIISAGMHDIVFTILLKVSGEPLALTPLNFNGIENVEELEEAGMHNYVAGISYDYDYATAVLQNEMRQAGFKDAAVIALRNGKKIPVEEAINLTKTRN